MDDEPLWLEFVLPPAYKEAIGEAIIQWAFFETSFNELLWLVRLDKSASALSQIVPNSFPKRVQLLRDSAPVAFASCPDLVSTIIAICADSTPAKRDRDLLAHCHWLGSPENGKLTAYNLRDNSGVLASKEIDLPWFKTLASKISALSRRARALTQSVPDYAFPLGSAEALALRDFRSRNLPKPPTPQFPRLLPPFGRG